MSLRLPASGSPARRNASDRLPDCWGSGAGPWSFPRPPTGRGRARGIKSSRGVLELTKEYPTPTQVLEASPEELAEIPYVSKEKAESIVAAARTSMVSQTDEETGLTLSPIAEDLLRLRFRQRFGLCGDKRRQRSS